MKFKTTIMSNDKTEWAFHCELAGKLELGQFDQTNPNSNQPVLAYSVGTVKYLDIILQQGNTFIHVDAIGGMPDQFSEQAISDLQNECLEALEEDLKFNEVD